MAIIRTSINCKLGNAIVIHCVTANDEALVDIAGVQHSMVEKKYFTGSSMNKFVVPEWVSVLKDYGNDIGIIQLRKVTPIVIIK
jgi:hypothetical protein